MRYFLFLMLCVGMIGCAAMKKDCCTIGDGVALEAGQTCSPGYSIECLTDKCVRFKNCKPVINGEFNYPTNIIAD